MDTTLKILELTALGTVPLFISQMILLQTHWGLNTLGYWLTRSSQKAFKIVAMTVSNIVGIIVWEI